MQQSCVLLFVLMLLFTNVSLYSQTPELDGVLFVVNEANSSVSVVFTDEGKSVIALPTGEKPGDIRISPNGKLAAVVNRGAETAGGSLTILDLTSFSVKNKITFSEFARPHSIAFLPDNKSLLVTLENRKSVAVYDLRTNVMLKEIATGQEFPQSIAIHPSGRAAYVLDKSSGSLSVIDLNDFVIAGTVRLEAGLGGLDVSPDGTEIWVINSNNHTISVIETTEHRITNILRIGASAANIHFLPDGNFALVTHNQEGYVSIFDYTSKAELFRLSVDNFTRWQNRNQSKSVQNNDKASPVKVTISSDGKFAFLTNSRENSVSVMHLQSAAQWTLAQRYLFEEAPGSIAYLPATIDEMVDSISDGSEGSDPNDIEERFFTSIDSYESEEFAREIEAPFLLVFTNKEMEEYETLISLEQKRTFLKKYIRQQNANPLSPINFWLLEFLERVQVAQARYSLKTPPYMDDRAKYYIKFGPPPRYFSDPGGLKRQKFLLKHIRNLQQFRQLVTGMAILKLPDAGFHVRPNESWSYDLADAQTFTVHFAKQGYFKEVDDMGGFLMSGKRSDLVWYWMELVKERYQVSRILNEALDNVERFEFENEANFDLSGFTLTADSPEEIVLPDNATAFIEERKSDIEVREREDKRRAEPNLDEWFKDNNVIFFDQSFAQFKNENGRTKIKMLSYTPPDNKLVKAWQSAGDTVNLEMEFLLRDSLFSEVSRGSTISKITTDFRDGNVVIKGELMAPPTTGDLSIQLKNIDTKEVGFKNTNIEVRDFSGTDLMISDVLYYSQYDENDRINQHLVEEINNQFVIPYFPQEMNKKAQLLCNFEIYNLLEEKIGNVYEIELRLIENKSGKGVLGKLGSLFSRGNKTIQSITYQHTALTNDSVELLAFDIGEVKAGSYVFEISVTSAFDESVTAVVRKELSLK